MPGNLEPQVDDDVRAADADVRSTITRYDPYWGGQLVIGAAILLQLSLSEKLTVGSRYLARAVNILT